METLSDLYEKNNYSFFAKSGGFIVWGGFQQFKSAIAIRV